jgi:cation diffusion facilitator CzcD-associated flavoprotein CzcO
MLHDVVIMGSGFGGLGHAINLRRAGIADVVILEKATAVGGTWRENRYPGCRCDVPSVLYSFSFAPNPQWSNTYSFRGEIWQYLDRVARDENVLPQIRFDHHVTDARWSEDRWILTTNHGVIEARCFIMAGGFLMEPRTPDIAGIETFTGRLVHTATWPDDLQLDNQSVAVIGTGASAVQAIPHIAKSAARLDVYQRTPAWILPHSGHRTRRVTQRLFRWLPFTQKLVRHWVYLTRELLVLAFVRQPERMTRGEAQAREFLDAQVPDAELRAQLTPTYRMGCKRIMISNDYLATFNRDHVSLVTSPITAFTDTGIIDADGVTRHYDTVIMATGFMVADNPVAEIIVGRDGVTLAEAYRGDVDHLYGTSIPGFPNMYVVTGPNTALGHSSMVFMMESQYPYITQSIRTALREHAAVEPTADAARRWTQTVRDKLPHTVWGSGCQSWYLNDRGVNTVTWPGFTFEYRRAISSFKPVDHRVTPTRHPVPTN